MPPLKCRIFRFLSKFVLLTQLSRKQIHISKIWLCHFLVYIAKYPYAKKIKNIHLVDPEKMCHRQTDKQTDRWTNEQNSFYRTPSVKMGKFDHVFQKFENKIFLNYLAWLWAIWKESIQNKCQKYIVDWRSNQKPFHHYQYTKIIQSICSTHQIICELQLI